jgi:DEAD/DEAH box helicase domain-containing protein
LTPQVVHGRPGYYLQTAWKNWLIEPQVELGPEQGVRVPCRADFVFYPARDTSTERPVVVFTDGFEFHADPSSKDQRLGLDTAQRLALLRSGRFRVWSLTWDDVRSGAAGLPFEPLGVASWETTRNVIQKLDPAEALAWSDLPKRTSFGLLLDLLGRGSDRDWSVPARAWLMGFLRASRAFLDDDELRRVRATLLSPASRLDWPPANSSPVPGRPLIASLVGDARLDQPPFLGLVACWAAALQDGKTDQIAGTFRLFEEAGANDREGFKRAWRQSLWLMNLLQFAPRVDFVTSRGLSDNRYGELVAEDPLAPIPTAVPADPGWTQVHKYAVHEVRQLVEALEAAGIRPPEVGYEILNGEHVAGVAELAWDAEKIAILSHDQLIFTHTFTGFGWTVFDVAKALEDPLSVVRALKKGSAS